MGMGKKKKNSAESVSSKKQKQKSEKKVNPFEVKFNRQKHNVLGRKISKHDRGMPGLSRSKALNKRKATLLQEYTQRFKSNKLVDRRIGEKDNALTEEDKMMKRYAKERLIHHGKDKFNLNEEDELTHYGQSLSEIEKFEEPVASDEEDDMGLIDAKMVSDEHFGGFFTKKEMEEKDDKRSWKERMEEVISKSKKEKHERQMEREKNTEMTEKLDAEWKELQFLFSQSSRKKPPEKIENEADDFDMMVRELKFEMKGKPTDRLKTEEELAKEEKEKLEELEMDRMRRMKGEIEKPSQKHKSADDLDDGFALDSDDKKVLSYKEGILELEDDSIEEADESDDNAIEEEEQKDSSSDEIDDDDDDDVAVDEDDDYEDLESEEEDPVAQKKIKPTKKSETKFIANLQEKNEVMEAARKELPYTFKAPEQYEDLLKLLHGHCTADQLIIVERIRKCHHSSLAEGNKQKMETFFAFLVQYFCDLAIQEPVPLELVDRLVQHLYELARQSPGPAAHAIRDQLSDFYKEFSMVCQSKSRGLYPAFDTFLLLKLISILYPTSDFRHPVTTPALLFIGEMLAKCRIDDARSVVAGLFVCNLCLEYVSLSKRFVPEAINFLCGLLFLAGKKNPNIVDSVILPFRPIGAEIDYLLVESDSSTVDIRKRLRISEVLTATEQPFFLVTQKFKLSVIHSTITLLLQFSELYKDLASYREVFAPVTRMAMKLPIQYYPCIIKEKVQKLLSTITTCSSVTKQPIVVQKRKPKPMKMFEPKIEEVFDGRKKKTKGTKEYNEKQRLTHKYKRELKGAKRDLKQDARFLARQQLNEQLERDEDRKRKVKEIHAMLANQEGDYQAMKRAKKS
ncbi:hypothetical protein ScPMuIL_001480 [Solemya velum]